jgi:hypothetical protein
MTRRLACILLTLLPAPIAGAQGGVIDFDSTPSGATYTVSGDFSIGAGYAVPPGSTGQRVSMPLQEGEIGTGTVTVVLSQPVALESVSVAFAVFAEDGIGCWGLDALLLHLPATGCVGSFAGGIPNALHTGIGTIDLAGTAMTSEFTIVFDTFDEFVNAGYHVTIDNITWTESLQDCNGNGVDDGTDIANGTSADCNQDGTPDECTIAADPSFDWDGDGVLDSCSGSSPVYCPGNENSVSATGGRLIPVGSPVVAANDLTLVGLMLPPDLPGYIICSTSTAFVDLFGGSAGVLCLGSPLVRLSPQNGYPLQFISGAGEFGVQVDLTSVPTLGAIQPGNQLNFQLWHRDFHPVTGVLTSNTTDAIAVLFR